MEWTMNMRSEIKKLAHLGETPYPFLSLYLNTKWDDEQQRVPPQGGSVVTVIPSSSLIGQVIRPSPAHSAKGRLRSLSWERK